MKTNESIICQVLTFLKGIFKLKVLGVVIAALQLVIAMPQLRLAYKSCTSDDMDRLKATIEDIRLKSSKINIVALPESITDSELLWADSVQQSLYLFVRTTASFDCGSFEKNDSTSKDYALNQYSNYLSWTSLVVENCRDVNRKLASSNDNNSLRLLFLTLNYSHLDLVLESLTGINEEVEKSAKGAEALLSKTEEFKTLIQQQTDLCCKYIELLNLYKIRRMHNIEIVKDEA